MKRSDVEDGVLALIAASSLGPVLQHGTLEIFDDSKIDNEGQIIVITPAVLLVPGTNKFAQTDVYGYTYGQQMFFTLLVAAQNYRSPESRRQGEAGVLGVNQMLETLKDALRGQNPVPAIYSGARIVLVQEDPEPEIGPGTVYSLTVRVIGTLE